MTTYENTNGSTYFETKEIDGVWTAVQYKGDGVTTHVIKSETADSKEAAKTKLSVIVNEFWS